MAEYTLNMTGEQIDAALVKANQSLSQTEVQTLLEDYEPVHETKTVTGTNGEITITEALDAPVIDFSATGLGAPAVFYVPNMSAQEQGQQDWTTPLCLDVPIGIFSEAGPILLNYGGGIGNNTFIPTAGKETGTTVFYNSRELVELFQAAMDADANTYNESGSPATTRFEVPLPFSVADGSTVYCSHLKNQNVAGEEGIWASGNTLYIRVLASRADKWSGLISIMGQFASNVNYYDPSNPRGTDPVNWLDFFVCVTASANYTKVGQASAVKLDNNTYNLSYMKISDYVAVVSGQGEANLTPIPSMSVTYYTNTNINKIQQEVMTSTITDQLSRTTAIGNGAYAVSGGAVGNRAFATTGFAGGNKASETDGGGAVGYGATATRGGAIGVGASAKMGFAGGEGAIDEQQGVAVGRGAKVTTTGGACGAFAVAQSGGAVGFRASAGPGGAVGSQSWAGHGFAGGYNAATDSGGAIGNGAICGFGAAVGLEAKCLSGNTKIDAIQLGTGTNATAYSMQVYTTPLLTPVTAGTAADGLVIPLPLMTNSYDNASTQDKTNFRKVTQDIATSTSNSGQITITNPLDYSVIYGETRDEGEEESLLVDLTVAGSGTPTVVSYTGCASAQGLQDWDLPLVLDVPLFITSPDQLIFTGGYGNGIGTNSYQIAAGRETGRLHYFNSKQLMDLFERAKEIGKETGINSVIEETNHYRFECPLPFAIQDNSVVYCSHLKNQNIEGEEGIWSSGSTLYLRIAKTRNVFSWSDLRYLMEQFSEQVFYYDMDIDQGDPEEFQDFFVMVSTTTDYTKLVQPQIPAVLPGTYSLYYFKISDMIAWMSGSDPVMTAVTNVTANYYTDTTVNNIRMAEILALMGMAKDTSAYLGSDAEIIDGGGGGAIGQKSRARDGGAIGKDARTTDGFAGGLSAISTTGSAAGLSASATTGAAIGESTVTSSGVALGYQARCCADTASIDAIQLGTGTNPTPYSMQVYTTPFLIPVTAGTANDGLVIPLSLITESYNAATTNEKNDFDVAIGNIVRYSITNDLVGRPVGTFVKLTSNNTVSEAFDDGDVFIGQLAEAPMSGVSTALVRIKGIMEAYANLNLGFQRVAFSDGALDVSANGREIFVTSSDNGKITFVV